MMEIISRYLGGLVYIKINAFRLYLTLQVTDLRNISYMIFQSTCLCINNVVLQGTNK